MTPPTFALIGRIKHAFVTAHVEPAALSVAVTESCAGKRAESIKRANTKNRYFFVPLLLLNGYRRDIFGFFPAFH